MTKSIITKALSVILVVAVCISTLSGLVSFSAASASKTYSIVGEDVAATAKKVTVTVTLTNPNGLTTGSFDLMFGQNVIDAVNFDANGNYVVPQNETYDEFMARDTDGNFMISAVNFYKTETYQVAVYDEEGNITGYETKTRTVLDKEKSYQENTGNKGVLLPNAYDEVVGLYDTKIEITGGTKLGGGSFNINDFVNSEYATYAKGENNTTHAKYASDKSEGADKSLVVDDDNDGRKYIYNMTDGYKLTHLTSTPITYVDVVENGVTVKKAVPNKNLLEKYYREYTTVDVATQNLGYKISTVSEDTVGSMHSCAQYAQGFKDVTFNSNVAYESITFTVTFDFSGTTDRISANNGKTLDEITGTATIDGANVTYRKDDGRWASENYVQNATKYALNFVANDSALSGLESVSENANTSFFHTHTGMIENNDGTAEPINKDAIDALLAKNPNAKEGVDYFELYNAKCIECGRISPAIAAPDLTYTVNGQSVAGQKGTYIFNSYRNLSGSSVVYEEDGSLSLNIHYSSAQSGEQMFITDQNGMVMKYSDTLDYANERESIFTSEPSSFASKKMIIETEDGLKEIGRYSGKLVTTAKMITVKGFSASDLDKTLYVARYTPSSSNEAQLMGMTHTISLADYLNTVITGDYDTDDKLVAAAMLNYSNASKTALSTPNDYKPYGEVDTFEGREELKIKYDQAGNKKNDPANSANWVLKVDGNGAAHRTWGFIDADLAGSGTKEDPYIIANAEQLFYIVKIAGNTTKGKYYKVKDGIKEFRLNPNITADTNFEEAIELAKNGTNWDSAAYFQGHFDGNGVIISGLKTTEAHAYSGLFPRVKGNVTIKNVTITNSRIICNGYSGAIVGVAELDKTDSANPFGSLTIENCSVVNCHMESVTVNNKYYARYGIGAVVGHSLLYVSGYNGLTTIRNCYVELDEDHFNSPCEFDDKAKSTGVHGGLVAYNSSNQFKAENNVVIGIKPYPTWASANTSNYAPHNANKNNFSNVYTDQDVDKGTNVYSATQIKKLTTEQLKGENAKANMSALDWKTTWHTNENGYPSLYNPYNIPKGEKATVYWDGTVASGIAEGSGTKADPYIINTASELAYVVKDKAEKGKATISVNADGTPKYFKVSDKIESIVLQPENVANAVMNLKDAAAVKEYFEKNSSSLKKWPNYGWEATAFAGVFDGNGVTVYGLYQVSANNAGLFSTVESGAAIKNIALKNSYITSTATNYQVGGIAAVSANTTKSGVDNAMVNNGIIWFDGCTVANNYMYNPATNNPNDRSGMIIGAASDAIYIDNCLIYDNDATYVNGKMPIVSSANNSIIVGSGERIPEGLVTVTDGATTNPRYNNMVRNSVILGNLPYDENQQAGARFNDARCYQNVYSDAPNGTIKLPENTTLKFNAGQIKQISAQDILGTYAKSVMVNLDWYDASANPNGKWYASKLNAMPSLSPLDENIVQSVGNAVPEINTIYNAIVFDDPDVLSNETQYHANGSMSFGVYQTAISLKTEPYMSFAFAFLDEYKENRDKIKIRFVYDGVTTESISVPACEYNADGSIKDLNKDGWTNKKSNGRYHTYKATNLPISALISGITVQMSYNGGEWKNYGTYSIEGLGYQFEELNVASPSEYYQTRIEALKALVLYIEARNKCFNAQ